MEKKFFAIFAILTMAKIKLFDEWQMAMTPPPPYRKDYS
jgi:hypothetical protein